MEKGRRKRVNGKGRRRVWDVIANKIVNLHEVGLACTSRGIGSCNIDTKVQKTAGCGKNRVHYGLSCVF